MPEIVVFKAAKPMFMLQNNSQNGSLNMKKTKLLMHDLRRIFLQAARSQKTGVGKDTEALHYKEIVILRHTVNDVYNQDLSPSDEAGPLRLMNESDFFNLMMFERGGSMIWRNIVYMQLAIKTRKDNTFNIQYMNQMESNSYQLQALKDAYSSFLSPEEDLMVLNPKEYCNII